MSEGRFVRQTTIAYSLFLDSKPVKSLIKHKFINTLVHEGNVNKCKCLVCSFGVVVICNLTLYEREIC